MNISEQKSEFRAKIAEEFLKTLNEQGFSWKCGWIRFRPYNGITKRKYSGINRFYLSLLSKIKGIEDPRWYTMSQIMDKKGKYHPHEHWHLQAGTKATYVEYWYQYDLVEKKSLSWSEYQDEINSGREPTEFRLSASYTAVFNAQFIDGVPELKIDTTNLTTEDNLIDVLAERMGVPLFYDGGDRAYYSPTKDEIHLPKPSLFNSEYELNATAAHELAHSTGHKSRLNRDQSGLFGTEEYAYEELVAEISACFMSINYCDVPTQSHIDNHKAYIQSWIKNIQDKPDVLMKAINDAQAAADYIEAYIEEISTEKTAVI